jgi:hypothetical protein
MSERPWSLCAALLGAAMCSGCAVPHYDVPSDPAGQPTVKSIADRIQCEIRDMVRDDMGDSDVTSFHRKFLLDGDYDVEVALSLEVNDTGGLAPSLTYMTAFNAATSFMFNGNATLSQARDHNFTANMQLSVRKIYAEWKTNANTHDCPTRDTNLSGTLGLKDLVAMAASTPELDQSLTILGKGIFGGSVQFIVTKNVSALGPTWSLEFFKGPGALASLSEVNTDKITVAFAQGPNVGKPMRIATLATRPNPANPKAHLFLQQLLTGSITTQLNALQNSLH